MNNEGAPDNPNFLPWKAEHVGETGFEPGNSKVYDIVNSRGQRMFTIAGDVAHFIIECVNKKPK